MCPFFRIFPVQVGKMVVDFIEIHGFRLRNPWDSPLKSADSDFEIHRFPVNFTNQNVKIISGIYPHCPCNK